MAILNFPASPSINDTYTENGVTYVWTGTYWTANTEAFNDVYVNIGGDTMWQRTPGKSLTRPPRTNTIECSWRLCPSPGMQALTSFPLVKRTRATFLIAELGFLGVVVYTLVHTPRRCGHESKAADLLFLVIETLPFLTSCAIVGIKLFNSPFLWACKCRDYFILFKPNSLEILTIFLEQHQIF